MVELADLTRQCDFEVTFSFKVKVSHEATMDYEETNRAVIEKAKESFTAIPEDAKAVVKDLTWDTEIRPLIAQANQLRTEATRQVPEGSFRVGVAEQLDEVLDDLKEYPQYRRQQETFKRGREA